MKRLLLLFLLGISLFAPAQEYALRHFSVTDGLPSGNIIEIYQDKKGFLWVSTLAGISRFDGKKFVNYSLEDGLPFSYNADFCEDNQGRLYVQYGDGVARFDGVSFFNYHQEYRGETLFIRDMISDKDGNVLVVSRDVLAEVSGDSLIFYPNEDLKLFYCALSDKDGNVLIGGSDGIYQWKDKKLIPFVKEPGERIQSMHIGPDGYIWYGMLHNKIKRAKYGPKAGNPVRVSIPPGDLGFVAAHMSSDSNYTYVGTQHGFLVYKDGEYIKFVNNFMRIPSNMVNALTVDREGNLWVGSLFGMWRFTPAFTTSFPNDSIIARNVYGCRVVGSDSLWFTDGFYQYSASPSGVHQIFKDKPEQIGEMPDIIQTPDNYTYFGAMLTGLVIRYPDGHYEHKKFGKGPFYRCNAMAYHKGKVYIGSSHGYYVWDKDEYTAYQPKELYTMNILGITANDDAIFIGTNHALYQKTEDSLIRYSHFFNDRKVVIEHVYLEGKYVYASTKGLGLLIAHLENGRLVKDTILTKKAGLPSNYVQSAVVDKMGQIWVSTLQGVAKIVQLSESAYYIKNYNRNQGIPDAFWEYGRFVKDTVTGNLWIGNSEGILKINPEKESRHVAVPIIQIEALAIQNEFESPANTRQLIQSPIADTLYQVPFHLNSLQIYLTGILLSGAEDLEYWYKLKGKNADWMPAPENGILHLNNLPPGDYELLVSAFNRSNKAYSEEKSIHFKIARPFWMSTWFYVVLILLFLLGVSLYFRWRIRFAFKKQNAAMEVSRQLSESRYLAFQARMNPHFIFNSLNAIQYFITQNDKKSSLTYLSKFARLLRQVLDHTKAVKVPLNEEIQMLTSYLEMEAMRFDGHFSYSFDVEEQLRISQIEIPGMLLQPYVENAIVHGLLHLESGAGHLTIQMKKSGDFIICTITDNGIGRKKSAEINSQRKPNHKSYGMDIASNRLELLVEDMSIEELIIVSDLEEGKGTRVQIKLPIL